MKEYAVLTVEPKPQATDANRPQNMTEKWRTGVQTLPFAAKQTFLTDRTHAAL